MLLLLLLHFAGFRKPKVFKRFDFVQRFFLLSFLDFSVLLCSLLSFSLSLSLSPSKTLHKSLYCWI
jgi:hypothetical protein